MPLGEPVICGMSACCARQWQAACVVFLIAACGSAYAQATGPYRPLVFIPGILGSELLDENDNLVWGGASSLAHFDELEITETGSVKRLHTGGLVKNISAQQDATDKLHGWAIFQVWSGL
jgi:hypothetical protein